MCYFSLIKNKSVAGGNECLSVAESLVPHMLQYLQSEYDDVSAAVIDFARDYLQVSNTKPYIK